MGSRGPCMGWKLAAWKGKGQGSVEGPCVCKGGGSQIYPTEARPALDLPVPGTPAPDPGSRLS